MILATATLLIRTVAKEFYAQVTALLSDSSRFLIFLKNISVSKCFGVSNSTIIVGRALTFVVKFCCCTLLCEGLLYFLIGITFLLDTGLILATEDLMY